MIERMRLHRSLAHFTAAVLARTAIVLALSIAVAPLAWAADPVNYDDPNLAFSNDYATDSATSCPKTMKPLELRKCLLKNGISGGEDPSLQTEILSEAAAHAAPVNGSAIH